MTAALNIPLEIRASQLAQIMQCMGPVVLSNLLPNETNSSAMEGTAAGQLLQYMLEQRTLTPQCPLVADNGVRFDEDMWFYVTPIAKDLLERSNGNQISCEVRIDFMTRAGILLRGQYDACWYDQQHRTLYVPDLKYGYGIVEVEENWQLITYAIGKMVALVNAGLPCPEVYILEIQQPRAYHPEGAARQWVISHAQMMEYYEKIEARFARIAAGDRELQTGPKCKYCRAAPVCPAFNKATHSALDYTLNDWVQDNMTNEALTKQLEIAERAAELIKIRIDSLTQLGIMRIKEGQIIPNRGLKQNYGHRKWKHMVTPESFKALTGVDIRETTIMSPAKVEKLGVSEDFVDALTERPMTSVKLVPMNLTAEAEKVFGKR